MHVRPKSPKPRVLEADRSQSRLVQVDLDGLVADTDPVRSVWAFVEVLDLSDFYATIKALEGQAGRPSIDPKILLALWIQATLDGVGSARELARLCRSDVRYQWICGGVTPEYHRLSDFRSGSEEQFDRLLTNSVTVLMKQGLVRLTRVAQDGMRVRANAGSSSFRSGNRLKELQQAAHAQVQALKEELQDDSSAGSRRRNAARLRAAEDRARKIKKALEELPEVEKRKKSANGKKKKEARASTTDPEARVMKMADGGFRPAFNVHFVTDTVSKVIAAVDVNNEGTDQRMTVPLAAQLYERHGINPQEWLEDGGCVTLTGVEALSERGTKVIAPIRAPRSARKQRTDIRSTDSPAIADWRQRMATEYAKTVYKLRGATAELVNAHVRRFGLGQFLVRSIQKARSVVLLLALTHNMRRSWGLT
jgi:transposase